MLFITSLRLAALRPVRLAALATLAALPLAAPASAAPAKPAQTQAQVQAEIWAKEQSIYAARGAGNLNPYINAVATGYAAWPPYVTAPIGVESLKTANTTMATTNHELLAMEFVRLVLNGDTAIIYYQTHRTRMPNGDAADERFDVVHVWVREAGAWKVLGGMARQRKS